MSYLIVVKYGLYAAGLFCIAVGLIEKASKGGKK
jgi:hypothetical protein